MYGTPIILNDTVKRVSVSVSIKPCQILHNEKDYSTKWLALNSGCWIEIRIKCLHDETTGFYVIEAFGYKHQLLKLTEMVSPLETFYNVT